MNNIRQFCCIGVFIIPWLAGAKGLTIWPLIAELPPGSKAVAIYLDNQSDTAQQLQIRVKQWQQNQLQDQFSDQTTVLVSPPFVTIEPRQRQLVRLVYLKAERVPAYDSEQSFRVLIDDVTAVSSKAGNQVHIRMRYSLPLFVGRPAALPMPADETAYREYWQEKVQVSIGATADGQASFRLKNDGAVHLRLSQVQLFADGQTLWSPGNGLFGYLLPNSDLSWQIKVEPPSLQSGGQQLQLQVESSRVQLQFPVTVIADGR